MRKWQGEKLEKNHNIGDFYGVIPGSTKGLDLYLKFMTN